MTKHSVAVIGAGKLGELVLSGLLRAGWPPQQLLATTRRPERAAELAEQLEDKTGKEARTVVLGHIQRGGTPTAFDRVLATRFGLQASDAVNEGDFGKMMALRGTDIVRVPLIEGTGELKTVPLSRYEEAEVFFGS